MSSISIPPMNLVASNESSLPSMEHRGDIVARRRKIGLHSTPWHKTDRNAIVIDKSFSEQKSLPDTILVEILSFCDDETLLSFRRVSKTFQRVEVPREMHFRTMKKVSENNYGIATEYSKTVTSSSQEKDNCIESKGGYFCINPIHSYTVDQCVKKKVVDEEHRKVWMLLQGPIETKYLPVYQKNCDRLMYEHPHHWSFEIVVEKVLKVIREMEFYNGFVFGYDERKARTLLLEKGYMDETDFPLPSERHNRIHSWKRGRRKIRWKKHLREAKEMYKEEKDDANEKGANLKNYPEYGKWKAEARVRELTMAEAFKILAEERKGDKLEDKKWHAKVFRKVLALYHQSASGNKRKFANDNSLDQVAMLLLSNAHQTVHLAEYSTSFHGLQMACRILLFRTIGGVKTELRLVSGKFSS